MLLTSFFFFFCIHEELLLFLYFLSEVLLFSFRLFVVHVWLRPHELQHTRLPCPSLSPGVGSNSSPLSWWCHPTISSSVAPFSSCPQSFPASGSFPVSQLFTSGGHSIGASASASGLPMNIQYWFPLGWTGWISLQFSGPSEFSPAPQFESISSLGLSLLYGPALTSVHDYWKNHSFDYMAFVGKVMSLLFNTLSGFVIERKLCGWK